MVTEESLRRSEHSFFLELPFPVLRRMTDVQILCCGLIFGATLTPAAMLFPLLIAALVCLRLWSLPKYFSEAELQALDPLDIEKTQGRMRLSSNDEGVHSNNSAGEIEVRGIVTTTGGNV